LGASCQDLHENIFFFSEFRICRIVCTSRFDTRGVRVVTNVKRVAVDARGADRRAASFADGEVVWSWRADAGAKSATMRFCALR
jgi:hypothetical protein